MANIGGGNYIVFIYCKLLVAGNDDMTSQNRMPTVTLKVCLLAAGVVRLLLFVYGLWQDAALTVKYTDIDYIVFTDAATFVSQVGSMLCTQHVVVLII